VVKMIGDEVMFAAPDAASGVAIGVCLAEAYADDEMLSDVRVGLACGTVLQREGDYYGPVVNVASRIVNIAAPGSVVVSDEVHQAVSGDRRWAWKPLRPRYLRDIGRVQLWVARPASAEPEDKARARVVARGRSPRLALREGVRQRVERQPPGDLDHG
jgi:adenylate cyclase